MSAAPPDAKAQTAGNAGETRRRNWGGTITAGFACFVVLYVLSVGPMALLMVRGFIPQPVVFFIYYPLIWICDTPWGERYIEPSLNWYVQLWGAN